MSDQTPEQAERDAFLAKIADNPLDLTSRKVFADWLDEHDEPEAADLQRSMTVEDYESARGLIESMAGGAEMDADELIEVAAAFLRGDDPREYCTGEYQYGGLIEEQTEEFWRAFAIVTGTPVRPDTDSPVWFSCAC